jgi:hypothetical protein
MTDYPSAGDPFVDATGRLTRYGHQWLTTVKDEVVEAATQATLAALTDITAELTNRIADLEAALADLATSINDVSGDFTTRLADLEDSVSNAQALAAEAVSGARVENIVPQLANFDVKVRGLGVTDYLYMPPSGTFNVYNVGVYGVPGGSDPGPPPGEFDILEP